MRLSKYILHETLLPGESRVPAAMNNARSRKVESRNTLLPKLLSGEMHVKHSENLAAVKI